ncbi:hypothetical protein RB653_005965 [Dictyostelium firmibasis]|uniref:Uncharacterized protein n=1 Tax=Dictyostelium firmibasis TaxID=79012 RepID=A0AAN7UDM8_9MYCE
MYQSMRDVFVSVAESHLSQIIK